MRLYKLTPLACILIACAGDRTTQPSQVVPMRLDIVSGNLQTATVGQELPNPLVVKVLDAYGNPVSGQIVNFHVTAGGGTVFAGSSLTSSAGIAQEIWTLGPSTDTQSVEARAVDNQTGLALVFATFKAIGISADSLTPPVPHSLIAQSDIQTGVVYTTLPSPLAVEVRDQHNNPMPSVAVRWTVVSGGGTVSPVTSITGIDGVTKTQWTLGGGFNTPQRVVVTLDSTPNVDTLTFSVTATTVISLNIVSGNNQTATVRTLLPNPIRIAARDPQGNPAVGITLKPEIPDNTFCGQIPALCSGVKTDTAGIADVPLSVIDTHAGTQSINIMASSIPPSVQFIGNPIGVTVYAIPDSISNLKPWPFVLTSSDTQLVVTQATDKYGNQIPIHTVVWTSLTPSVFTITSGGVATIISSNSNAGLTRCITESPLPSTFAHVVINGSWSINVPVCTQLPSH